MSHLRILEEARINLRRAEAAAQQAQRDTKKREQLLAKISATKQALRDAEHELAMLDRDPFEGLP